MRAGQAVCITGSSERFVVLDLDLSTLGNRSICSGRQGPGPRHRTTQDYACPEQVHTVEARWISFSSFVFKAKQNCTFRIGILVFCCYNEILETG